MCFSAPKITAPPPPAPVTLPPAPSMANTVSPAMTQAAPAMPKEAPGANPMLRRRGKRALIIPMTGAPGVTIPGA